MLVSGLTDSQAPPKVDSNPFEKTLFFMDFYGNYFIGFPDSHLLTYLR